MLRRISSVMDPFQSAFRMALSIASILSHPCSTMTSGKYVAESVLFLETKRGRKLEEESGDGADESVDGYIDGFGKLMCIPWTPTVQSRCDDASSKSVNNDTLWTRGGLRTRHLGKGTGCEKADTPAFEQRKLLCVDLLESGVLEGTYERIFSDAFAYRHGLKVAYATSQLGRTSWTRGPDVPSDEEGARSLSASRCHPGYVTTTTHNLWSRKEGGIGVLPVRAQYKASKAWKQCSGAQVLSTSTAVRPPEGLTGRRDMAAKGQETSGDLIALKAAHVHLPIWAAVEIGWR